MTKFAMLNELSFGADFDRRVIETALIDFCSMLKAVRGVRKGVTLLSRVRLPNVELAEGYTMSQWVRDPHNRDRWQTVRLMQSRAPITFAEAVSNIAMTDIEYSYKGVPAEGLGVAHYLNGLAVSLPVGTEWSSSVVQLILTRLITRADSPELDHQDVSVRHASTAGHVQEVDLPSWGIEKLDTGQKIWEARDDYFPNLVFLPRVEKQLCGLDPHWVSSARSLLADLERALRGWDPARTRFPTWAGISPESETRKRHCYFEDLDGVIRLFDLHGRFAPEPGRLYFRLAPETQKAVIAHIGRKIDA